jgi:pSer/pThr/pTyr-binding forkhead associated (FHA) protein
MFGEGAGDLITQQRTTTMLDDEFDRSGPPDSRGLHVLAMSPDSFISLPLPADGFVYVGRSAKCQLRLDDPLASREHARLFMVAGADGVLLQIEDLDSANGTRVRDKVIRPRSPVPFLVGDAIIIGFTVLMVQRSRLVPVVRRLWSRGDFRQPSRRSVPGGKQNKPGSVDDTVYRLGMSSSR